MKLILFLIFCPLSLWAGSLSSSNSFENFNDAKKSESYLKFVVESTKVGLFSSDVDGYVKKFTAKVDEDKNQLSNMVVEFPVDSMDTDSESRDEKLHNLCMEKTSFPTFKITIKGPLKIEGKKQIVDAILTVRGKEKIAPISLTLSENEGQIQAMGKSVLSLKELEIPDPSIAVAKLSDDIKIEFKIYVTKK